MNFTKQEELWFNNFGKEYSDRNSWNSDEEWDSFYRSIWGNTKIEINQSVLNDIPKDIKILEVGCNIGMQLKGLQRMGFNKLYGIELQQYAVEKSKAVTEGINIIQGTGFDIPFRDNFFDLVCTNGVLIHIAPNDHIRIMSEIFRTSKKYILGWEYYSNELVEVNYHGNDGYLWKADFPSIYQSFFPNLKLVKRKKYTYKNENEKIDEIFLLSK